MEISLENLYVDTGAYRVKHDCIENQPVIIGLEWAIFVHSKILCLFFC